MPSFHDSYLVAHYFPTKRLSDKRPYERTCDKLELRKPQLFPTRISVASVRSLVAWVKSLKIEKNVLENRL